MNALFHAAPAAPGFADPVLESQATFRVLLEALGRPGRIYDLPALPPAPAPLSPAAAAVALAMTDLDAPVWLDGALATGDVSSWLRFHAGCPISATPETAAFALIADMDSLGDLMSFSLGTPEYPETAATLVIQTTEISTDTGVVLRGPGIKDSTRLHVGGLPSGFWAARRALTPLFPQGIDVLFVTAGQVCGLPRTTVCED